MTRPDMDAQKGRGPTENRERELDNRQVLGVYWKTLCFWQGLVLRIVTYMLDYYHVA